MILQVGRGIFGDFFFGRCYPCTKYAWLSTNQEGVLLVFTFKVNSLHKNLTYFLMQQFYQQTARRAETSSTMYISGKPQQTNPQKYGPLDESGGAYMLRYSEQTRVYKIDFKLLISQKFIGTAIKLIASMGLKQPYHFCFVNPQLFTRIISMFLATHVLTRQTMNPKKKSPGD